MLFTRRFEFDAAHTLPCQFGEKETKLHGHRYRIDVTVRGSPGEGMMVDLEKLKTIVQTEILIILDHAHLNEIVPIPSSENIAQWSWNRLKSKLQGLSQIIVYETPNHWVTYTGEED